MTEQHPLVITELRGSVLCITFNRPDKFSSFNRRLALELQAALDRAANEANIRAVYMTGTAKRFVPDGTYRKRSRLTDQGSSALSAGTTIR